MVRSAPASDIHGPQRHEVVVSKNQDTSEHELPVMRNKRRRKTKTTTQPPPVLKTLPPDTSLNENTLKICCG